MITYALIPSRFLKSVAHGADLEEHAKAAVALAVVGKPQCAWAIHLLYEIHWLSLCFWMQIKGLIS